MEGGGLESVPEHLRASVLELAGALAEDYPDRSTDALLQDAAAAVMQLEAEERWKRWKKRARRVVEVVSGATRALLLLAGVSFVFWRVMQPSRHDVEQALHEERYELLESVPAAVARQAKLVPPLIALGANSELLRQSAVPKRGRFDERLELAIDLQGTLELEHSSVVPSSSDDLERWATLLDQLEAEGDALRTLDARLQANSERIEEVRNDWWTWF